MNTTTMSERRSEQRYEICWDANLEGTRANVRVTDISEGGCYVDSTREAYIGEILTVRIQLPNREWFDVDGVVAHQIPRLGFGLKFVNLSNLQAHTLRWLIASLRERNKSVPAKLVLVA